MNYLLALCLFAGTALATPVDVTLFSGGPLNDPAIGPYLLQIGQDSLLSAMCFDDQDQIYVGESWLANFLAPVGIEQDAEVWLFTQINSPSVSDVDETAIQQAAWSIADPSAPVTALSANL